MNNKGMAISSILYTILILFLALLFGILGLISSSKKTFDTLKDKLYNDLNSNYPDVFLTTNQEDSNKMDIKIISRKYIDSYYLTTSSSVDEQTFNTNKTQLENPSENYTLTQTIEHSTYYLYLKDIHDVLYKYKLELFSASQEVYDFSYTGNIQTFTVPQTGMYKLEVWGAQGGSISTTYTGGKGGYATGNVSLNKNDVLYIVVGGQGENCQGNKVTCNGGYNGGGSAKTYSDDAAKAAGGGGATHIGTFNEVLSTHATTTGLYIVAAGGGGSHSTNTANRGAGGVGGGTTGGSPTKLGSDITKEGANFVDARLAIPGTNASPACTASNLNCSYFGHGGNPNQVNNGSVGSGGGAGVYGGSGAYLGPGAGGASWIEGVLEGNTIAGDQEMPDYNGTTMTGNTGNGYARITSLSGGHKIGKVIPVIYDESCALQGNCSNETPIYGLYTKYENGELVASWDELVNTYGLDISKDCTPTGGTGCGLTVLKNNNLSGVLIIPPTVTKIGKCQFRASDKLTSVYIPSSVLEIGAEAFRKSSITKAYFENTSKWYVNLPAGYESANVNDPSSAADTIRRDTSGNQKPIYRWVNKSIESDSGTSGDTNWTLDASTKTLTISGTGAMQDYTSTNLPPWSKSKYGITKIVIGENVTKLGDYAFYDLAQVTNMRIDGKNLSDLSYDSSDGNKGTNYTMYHVGVDNSGVKLIFGPEVTRIPRMLMKPTSVGTEGPKITNLVFEGNKITSVPEYGLAHLSVTQLKIPNAVTSLAGLSLGRSKLMTFYVGNDSVLKYTWTFSENSKLEKVLIGDSLLELKNGTFRYCTSLKTIVIPHINNPSVAEKDTFYNATTENIDIYGDSTVNTWITKLQEASGQTNLIYHPIEDYKSTITSNTDISANNIPYNGSYTFTATGNVSIKMYHDASDGNRYYVDADYTKDGNTYTITNIKTDVYIEVS